MNSLASRLRGKMTRTKQQESSESQNQSTTKLRGKVLTTGFVTDKDCEGGFRVDWISKVAWKPGEELQPCCDELQRRMDYRPSRRRWKDRDADTMLLGIQDSAVRLGKILMTKSSVYGKVIHEHVDLETFEATCPITYDPLSSHLASKGPDDPTQI